jgi:glycosyltransferase involved in cell wall biosynthesis
MQALSACVSAGKRVIIELDRDYHHLPPDHPEYKTAGPGNPAALTSLEAALAQADLLVVASPMLARQYDQFARRVEIISDSWRRDNPLWHKPAPRRNTINLGWAGSLAECADITSIRQAVIRIVRELPETMLVIAGEPAVYEEFAALPEARRLYLPPMAYDDFPFTLAHFDVLLLPWRDLPYNRSRSDLAALEAGVRGLPWVASPVPAYEEWGAGGLFAATEGEWHATLKWLIEDPATRRDLGEAGRAKALPRDAAASAEAWQRLVLDSGREP